MICKIKKVIYNKQMNKQKIYFLTMCTPVYHGLGWLCTDHSGKMDLIGPMMCKNIHKKMFWSGK